MSLAPVSEFWRLSSFNIQFGAAAAWLRKREALAAHLRELQTDVLCLQEVSSEGFAWLRKELGDPPAVGVGREDGINRGEHAPIFVLNSNWTMRDGGTFWFSDTPDRPSRSWGAAHPRICSWAQIDRGDAANNTLTIFNLHLDHRSRRARTASVALLHTQVERLAPTGHVVLCGDFNLRAHNPLYPRLLDGNRTFADAALAAQDTANSTVAVTPTWLGWGRFGWGRARIDYVLSDQNLPVHRYHVGDHRHQGLPVSDHRPVVVDFGSGEDFNVPKTKRGD